MKSFFSLVCTVFIAVSSYGQGQTLNLYFLDLDGDGFGDPHICKLDCIQPVGYVTNNLDCDDTKAGVHPGATEICGNGIDDNCNGQIDEAGCFNCNVGMLPVTVTPTSGPPYTLYVYPTDNSTSIQWGGFGTDIPALPNITTTAGANADFNGVSNTIAIVAQLGNNGGVAYAAKLCADLVVNGCDDWYLPSAGELNAIYQHLGPTPNNGFANAYYWSSSEFNGGNAWGQDFANGIQLTIDKSISSLQLSDLRCRCVRR
jgi:hypothetical protein